MGNPQVTRVPRNELSGEGAFQTPAAHGTPRPARGAGDALALAPLHPALAAPAPLALLQQLAGRLRALSPALCSGGSLHSTDTAGLSRLGSSGLPALLSLSSFPRGRDPSSHTWGLCCSGQLLQLLPPSGSPGATGRRQARRCRGRRDTRPETAPGTTAQLPGLHSSCCFTCRRRTGGTYSGSSQSCRSTSYRIQTTTTVFTQAALNQRNWPHQGTRRLSRGSKGSSRAGPTRCQGRTTSRQGSPGSDQPPTPESPA